MDIYICNFGTTSFRKCCDLLFLPVLMCHTCKKKAASLKLPQSSELQRECKASLRLL